MLRIVLVLSASLALQPGAIERGRDLSQWQSADSIAQLTLAASPELVELIEDSGGAGVIAEQLGREIAVEDEFAFTLNGLTTYSRLSRFERAPWIITTLVWDGLGVVNEASVRETIAPVPAPPETWPELLMSLPFGTPEGAAWLVSWGGDNFARNYHTRDTAQSYAYDFKLVRDGWSFQGPRDRNASYYCWGQPVYAPAPGRIRAAVDGVADNETVGAVNNAEPLGNHVVIEHGPGLFSVSAHLRSGSVAVRAGDTVEQGAALGACGNSGNSTEPHVHFHLQTEPEYGAGESLPAPFSSYLADGERIARGAPLRGQLISP